MLRCLLFSPCRDLKPENILLDDYGKSGTGRWGPFPLQCLRLMFQVTQSKGLQTLSGMEGLVKPGPWKGLGGP